MMSENMQQEIDGIVSRIMDDYRTDMFINKVDTFLQPNQAEVMALTDELFQVAYLGYFKDQQENYRVYNMFTKLSMLIEDLAYRFNKQIRLALRFRKGWENKSDAEVQQEADRITQAFLDAFPKIRAYLDEDLQAALDGDPATGYKEEIMMCYPGFYAITVNRFAHELFRLDVPLVPRIMTEHAHSRTGIDIHPGATIGRHFFIDHGTGVVVGETTIIGDNVKLYQGVTLGGLSTRGGQKLRGTRRHPTIEDNVTIYAGASILGGETVIGHDSVVGSNVFITKSIAPGTRVSLRNQELSISYRKDVQRRPEDYETLD